MTNGCPLNGQGVLSTTWHFGSGACLRCLNIVFLADWVIEIAQLLLGALMGSHCQLSATLDTKYVLRDDCCAEEIRQGLPP